MAQQRKNNLLQFFLVFLLVYAGTQFFFADQGTTLPPSPGLELSATSSKFTIGHHPSLVLQNVPASRESQGPLGWVQSKFCSLTRVLGSNKTVHDCRALAVIEKGETFTLASRCPQAPVDLYSVQESATGGDDTLTKLTASGTVIPCESVPSLAAGDSVTISLAPWKYSFFEKAGTFEARLPSVKIDGVTVTDTTGSESAALQGASTRFVVREPGVFTKLFRTFVTAPLLNFLILIASFMPGHNLGLAIILLTIAIKLLLFLPTQHAMEGQKKMQMLQPKLQELQKKYEGDQKKIQEETMKLWKEHKINPFSSCLPMLLQFPILIGLFYTVRDGSTLDLSRHLIYDVYQHLDWHFGTQFLGLDLLKPEIVLFPISLVVLQFLQMKLSFAIQKRKTKKKGDVVDVGAKDKKKEGPADAQQLQQRMMLYGLPIMIGVFALQMPSAVAIYWGVSTLFGIGQQLIVNREHLKV